MKKILYIDMDGTIANLMGRLTHYHPAITNWYHGDENIQNKFMEVCTTNRNIFGELDIIEGADEAIEELKELFDIYFLSVPMWDLPESFTDKRLWIEKHFGEYGRNRLILSAHKHLNNGDFLVDDTTRHGVDRFTGEHIHIFTDKFPDWKTVVSYLKKKLDDDFKEKHNVTMGYLGMLEGRSDEEVLSTIKRVKESKNIKWKDANTNPPEESGRYWCYVMEQNDLGLSHYQWNCSYSKEDGRWLDNLKDVQVTHWVELLPPAK